MDECSQLEKVEIQLLLEGIYRQYGFDFRNYAFPSIRRRIWYRIKAEGLANVSALQERILHHPEVAEKLFEDFSINVTEMFRNPSFFLALRKRVIPLLKAYPYIRIWHAGCSSGEEVYSMAILLSEEGLYERTLIYATDLNDTIYQRAKAGVFNISKMKEYTKNYIEAGGSKAFSEYYSVEGNEVIFNPSLGKNIVFAQHNLATDGSFNEFNLIVCRNVLIYFNKDLQERVHSLFFESLAVNGILALGNKENIRLTSKANCYTAIDPEEKIYQKLV